MIKNINYISIFQIFLILGIVSIVSLCPTLGFGAGDPLVTLNTNLEKSISTFQLVALSIAGVAFIGLVLMGMFTQFNTMKLIQIGAGVFMISVAIMIVDWIASWK